MTNKRVENEVLDVLIALGYGDAKCTSDDTHYKISFRTYNGGSDYMSNRHKDVIRILAGEDFMEFHWENDFQNIYLTKK